jgi:hypothetical protein
MVGMDVRYVSGFEEIRLREMLVMIDGGLMLGNGYGI